MFVVYDRETMIKLGHFPNSKSAKAWCKANRSCCSLDEGGMDEFLIVDERMKNNREV